MRDVFYAWSALGDLIGNDFRAGLESELPAATRALSGCSDLKKLARRPQAMKHLEHEALNPCICFP